MVTIRQALGTAIVATMLAVSPDAQQHKPAPGHMEHRFDDPERYAKSFDDPARDQWQMPERVIEALGLKAGESIADIGAGTGYFSVRLAKAVPTATVYAVDIEPSMLAHIRKRAEAERLKNIVAVQAAAGGANLPQPVDIVLIVNTYHHLPNRVAYFEGLKKSLQPSARVAIVDFRKDAPGGPPVEFRLTAEQIEGELRDAGYRLDARHDFLPRQHFLVFRPGP
jgi:ubiquinone/menaquinone biosynthesis C-methylase UbiE